MSPFCREAGARSWIDGLPPGHTCYAEELNRELRLDGV